LVNNKKSFTKLQEKTNSVGVDWECAKWDSETTITRRTKDATRGTQGGGSELPTITCKAQRRDGKRLSDATGQHKVERKPLRAERRKRDTEKFEMT